MPKIIYNFFSTTAFDVTSKFTNWIYAIIPISLAFTVKNKTKRTVIFILGGIYLLYGLYEVLLNFIK